MMLFGRRGIGQEAQTLVSLSAVQVLAVENDLGGIKLFYACFTVDLWFLIYKLLCSSYNGNHFQSMTLLLRRARRKAS